MLVGYSCPVYITGNFNIHVEDNDDQHTAALLEILQTFDLTQHVREQTPHLGEMLDLLICDRELQLDDLAVIDIGVF